MEERNITVTLNKAKEWFNSGNATTSCIYRISIYLCVHS